MKTLLSYLTGAIMVLAGATTSLADDQNSVDQEIAPVVSERTLIFIEADIDQSGDLNRKEFRQFIKLLAKAGHSSAAHVRFFRLYSLAWATVDQNQDGVASRDELRTAKSNYRKDNKRVTKGNGRSVPKPLS